LGVQVGEGAASGVNPEGGQLRSLWLGLLLIAVAVIGLYLPVAGFEFLNLDDNIYIYENPQVKAGLSAAGLRWALTSTELAHWFPLTWLSHMLDVELFGLAPGPHHLTNVVIHAANGVLCGVLVFQLSRSVGVALFVAGLFALHPMRLESVAWVAERKDVLSVFFGLGSLIAYLSAARTDGPLQPARIRMVLAWLLLMLSLLSKPTLMTLPLLLVLLDWWPLGRIKENGNSWRFLLRAIAASALRKWPFFLLSIASGLITIFSQSVGGGLQSLEGYPLLTRLASAGVGYWTYLFKLFWPDPIAIFYPFREWAFWQGGLAWGSLLIATIAVVRIRKNHEALLFGWFWFLVTLVPVIGIVQIGGQFIADRWSYLPHIGLLIAGAIEGGRVLRRQSKVLGLSVALMLLAGAAWTTRVNLPHWRNSETIFRHTIAVTENNFLAETNLGVYLERAGRIAEAYQLYEIAYRHNPAYPEAINHLGLVRAEQNRMQEAFELFTESVRRRPGFTVARYNRGLALVRLGREVEAGAEWLEVLRSAPTYKDVEPSLEWLARVAFSRPCNALRGVDTDAASRFSEIVTVTEAQLRQRGFLEQFRYAEQCARAGVVR
jgi:hypothetical protein